MRMESIVPKRFSRAGLRRVAPKWIIASVLGALTSTAGQAAVTINILQVGSRVVATASGTLDLTGMREFTSGYLIQPYIEADRAAVSFGQLFSTDQIASYDSFLSVPTDFGLSSTQYAVSAFTGDHFLVTNNLGGSGNPGIAVDAGFVSGSAINASDIWPLKSTIANLGLTAGTYTYVLPHDTITINIGPVSGVPEPATWAMFIGGFGIAGSAMRRRQRASIRFA